MKKRKSVIIYPLLCSSVFLTALLSPMASPVSVYAADAASEAGTEEAAASGEQGNTSESDPVSPAVMPPELILSKCYLLESDNYESIADGYFQAALLSEESSKQYPALMSGLTEFNKQITASCREDFKELADKSRQYIADNGITDEDKASATFESRIVPVRQDDKAVSFFTSCYSFLPGAAGGTTTFRGVTLDTATGKTVSLEDVIKDLNDKKALVAAVNENLRFLSTGDSAGDREESISEALASVNFFPSWVISDSGVIFRFDPGAISTEEEGAVEAEISFEKYPGLFTDAYKSHKGAYTLPVDTVYPLMVDLNGDGVSEKVSLNARPDDSGEVGSYTALRVAVGDKECLHETYFFNARGVLVHTDAGKSYLYVQTITDNDYRITCIFDLSGEVPVFLGELNGTGFSARFRRDVSDPDLWYMDEQFISSPDSFCLDTHMDLMSTYSATARYKVGEDGMPVLLSSQYLIDSDLELTSLTDLPADIVDPATGEVTTQNAVLPKGSKCSLYRTNGKDAVDVKTVDGIVYRFIVTEEWPQKVNGLRLDQAFDGTMFAG